MGLIREIGDGQLALDTVAFIYFIEEHPRFLPVLDPVFAAIDEGRLPAFASSLTLLEVLVIPYRAGNVPLAERYGSSRATRCDLPVQEAFMRKLGGRIGERSDD